MSKYKVVVSDQVFPSVEAERAPRRDRCRAHRRDRRCRIGPRHSGRRRRHSEYVSALGPPLDRPDRCRIIARYGIGFDNIDLEAARRRDRGHQRPRLLGGGGRHPC